MDIGKNKKVMNAEEKYKLIIAARNFHYDNFSKWMTYFYVAIGALFVGYCTLISGEIQSQEITEIKPLILLVGYIISVFWYLSSKGYYHWNINFINLVNYYERDVLKFEETERVYFVHANKDTQNNYLSPIYGANISTSKIAILFAFIISVFWCVLLLKTLMYDCLQCLNNGLIWIILFVFSVIITLIVSVLLGKFLKSYVKHFPNLKFSLDDDK